MPKETSFAMHATLVNHYLYGGSYPRGGASEIAFHLIPPILRAGGKVLVRAAVKEIIINESGRAIGMWSIGLIIKGHKTVDLMLVTPAQD